MQVRCEIREYPGSDASRPAFRGRTSRVGYYLGIDGGGTKTTCVVGDKTRVLAIATAGPSNILRVGKMRARKSLRQAIRQACRDARVDPQKITRTCMGVAGGTYISDIIAGILSGIVAGEIEVRTDSAIALHAAFGAGPGIIVIAGTGSIAYGRNAEGKAARAGGWGFAVSDEGSGHWIGRTAISAALRARDEQHETSLISEISKAWGASNVDNLIRAANASPAPDFSALFPVVLTCAESGDAIAVLVLTRAGEELAQLAGTVGPQLFAEGGAIPVAMAGSVFRQSPLVRQVFADKLHAEFSTVALKEEVVDPVQGALELARTGIGQLEPSLDAVNAGKDEQGMIMHMTLDAISNDYEYLDDQILKDVGTWAAEEGISFDRAAVIRALETLVKDGYAQTYRLSPQPPHCKVVPYDPASIEELAFYVTNRGRERCIQKQDQGFYSWP
jgi:glucosamine kinase